MPIVSSSFPITTQKNWVASGDFATDITGWNDFGEWAAYTNPSWHPNGGLTIHADGGTARMQQVVTGLTVGNKYLYQYECGQADEGNSYCHLGTTEGGVEYVANLGIGHEGQHSHVFTATTTSLYIQLGATDGLTVTYRDVSLHDLGGDSTADMSTDAYTPSADFPVGPPALTLDFANSRQLDPRISFTRASGATCLGRNGLIIKYKANEPRFDHYRDGRCKGFLIEKSVVNKVTDSEDLTAGSQNLIPSWSTGIVNITADQATAPDGTTTASSFKGVDSTVGRYSLHVKTGNSFADNTSYTMSMFVKRITDDTNNRYCTLETASYSTWANAGSSGAFDLVAGSRITSPSSGIKSGIQDLNNGWYRIWINSTTATTGGSTGFYLNICSSAASSAAESLSASQGLYLWGVQAEEGTYLTSYIPSSGAESTRAADRPFIWGQNFSEWFNPTGEGTWLAKVHLEKQETFVHGYNPWSPGNRYGSGTTSVPYPSLHAANFRNALAIAFYANTGNVAYGNYNTVNAYSSHAPCDSNDEEIMHCVSYDIRNAYGKNLKVVCDHNDGTISGNQSPNYAADAGSASAYRDLNTHFDTLALGGNVPWEGPWGNISYNGIQMVWLMSLRYWPGRMTDSQMLSVVSNHTT